MKHHFLTVAALSFIAFMASSCCNPSKRQNRNHPESSGNLVAIDQDGKVKSGGLLKTKNSPGAYADFVFVKVDSEKVLARKKLIEIMTNQH